MTMIRAAIYARYSSDLQSANSIEDQLSLCRDRVAQLGAETVEIYTDAAISGAQIMTRAAVRKLLADARAGRFDILLTEALDRLSRSQADIATIFERLSHAGIRIITLSEGEVSELHIGLKGTMNALFLKDLAAKVRRGQRGMVDRGKASGGLAYGYRVVRRIGPDGEVETGLREIHPDQAEVIRRIFREFIDGRSSLKIASGLNSDGIPAPRGGLWNRSSISGNRGRAGGILHNRLYIGRITYGRLTFRKDPDTGRKRGTAMPESGWTTQTNEAMRIIDDETWHQAQKALSAYDGLATAKCRRPKRLLSGLVTCGCCGAAYIVIDKERMGCSSNKEGRGCTNGRRVHSDMLERRTLDGLRNQMLAPDAISAFVREYHAIWKQQRADSLGDRSRIERSLKEVEGKIGRIVTAIAEGTDVPAMRTTLKDLEGQRAGLARRLADMLDPTVIPMQPNLTETYQRLVDDLAATLNAATEDRTRAFGLLRGLIDRIVLHPTEKRAGFEMEIFGQLAGILRLASGQEVECSPTVLNASNQGLVMAEGGGFEPPIGI